jgi:hypothetical protein
MNGSSWLQFLRQYGPVPRNDNMYDETIQRSARRTKVQPVEFEHPFQDSVLSCFDHRAVDPISVVLTGTAGDGKTHLCRQVWENLTGDAAAWAADDPYLSIQKDYPLDRQSWPEPARPEFLRTVTIHFIRDLSGWAPQQGLPWEPAKDALLQKLSRSLFDPQANDVFLIAANDGQLIEAWRRLTDSPEVLRTRALLEELLVEDKQEAKGARLRMYNLSRGRSAELFDRAYTAFINHPGWKGCYADGSAADQPFGPRCPIRHNFELLKSPLIHSRVRALIQLCDHNGLHLPVRQILLLLSNAVLGHPDCKDHLMRPADVPKLLQTGTVSKASLYNNIFGGNLLEIRRQGIAIFDYFERFQIGYETSNRIDNILIFGEGDPDLGRHFTKLLKSDIFYGADERYFAARDRYIEGTDDNEADARDFLEMLVFQRRGLFFKIQPEEAEELKLWELTVFRSAGQYLTDVVEVLHAGGNVKRPILNRLIKGFNRIFTGMLVNSERELLLATSGNYSQAKISRILADRVSVEPRHGERVILERQGADRVFLVVYLNPEIKEQLELNLVRFEFLSRVATEGALPASFSKECYEDILAFKSRLLAAYSRRRLTEAPGEDQALGVRLLNVSMKGLPEDRFVEVIP